MAVSLFREIIDRRQKVFVLQLEIHSLYRLAEAQWAVKTKRSLFRCAYMNLSTKSRILFFVKTKKGGQKYAPKSVLVGGVR